MVAPFDIFKTYNGREPVWLDAAGNIDDAIARVRQIGAMKAGKYLIHSRKTGVEIFLKVQRAAGTNPLRVSEFVTVRRQSKLVRKPSH